MASVFGFTYPSSCVEYSIIDGKPREFVYRGETLLDLEKGIQAEGWIDSLAEFVSEFNLDRPNDMGNHAFVYWLIEQGRLASPSGEK